MSYLKATDKLTPAVSMDAEAKINLGYQRLLTFEVKGGGFDWFGRSPANVILTGVALQEFTEMNAVYSIDTAVVDRARAWLLAQQHPDGSWSEGNLAHSVATVNGDLPVTAYSVWSLCVAGRPGTEVSRGLGYLRAHLPEAKDAYTLALAANAFLAADPSDPDGRRILDELDASAERDETHASWGKDATTFCGGYGRAGQVETTALVTLAMLQGKKHLDTAGKAITYLISAKDPNGGWQSTQATILALRALVRGARDLAQGDGEGTVEVKLNGKSVHRFVVERGQGDVVQMADLSSAAAVGDNSVELSFTGKGSFAYQVCGRYYLPWNLVPKEPNEKPLDIEVKYDRTTLSKDDTLDAVAKVTYRGAQTPGMVIVDLGIPPGFDVDPGSFAEMVSMHRIEKFSLTGRQVTLYIARLEAGKPLEIKYSMKARFPLRAKTPASTVYEYYAPDRRAEAKPVDIEVR